MTYSNNPPDMITPTAAATPTISDVANLSGIFQALMKIALMLLAKFARSHGPKSRNALRITLALLLVLHRGTDEEKKAFLKDLIAISNERLDKLYAAYRIWRQRKCWAWGGGFRCAALSIIADLNAEAKDAQSHDALIPD